VRVGEGSDPSRKYWQGLRPRVTGCSRYDCPYLVPCTNKPLSQNGRYPTSSET
jgi:hypothetical protein